MKSKGRSGALLFGGLAREMAINLEDAALKMQEGLSAAMDIAIQNKDVKLQEHLLGVQQDSTKIIRLAALWQRGDMEGITTMLAPTAPTLPAEIEETDQ